jgi:hypothetical protein
VISAPAGSSLGRTAPVLALLGLATLGLAAVVAALSAPALPFSSSLHLAAGGRVLLGASTIALVIVAVFMRHGLSRRELLATGLAGLGAQAVLMALAQPLLVALALLLIGFAHATRPSPRSLAARARGPAFAALLLGLGWALLHSPGPTWLGRVSSLALALGLAAAAGVLPYLPDVDPAEPASSSYLVWTAFFGPALALVVGLPGPLLFGLNADEAAVFGSTLVGLGLINLGWGTIGAWRTASDRAAWRYSFLADWGLVLVGLGLFRTSGEAGAVLGLVSIVMIRLPLCLWARGVETGADGARSGSAPLRVVLLTVMLAGVAPFAGFPLRLLVLQAATQTAWPLAAALLLGMLLWIGHAARLARTVDPPRGWPAVGLWITMTLSVAIGLAPGVVRAMAGF